MATDMTNLSMLFNDNSHLVTYHTFQKQATLIIGLLKASCVCSNLQTEYVCTENNHLLLCIAMRHLDQSVCHTWTVHCAKLM